jgi:hypothetical protein
LLSKLALQRSCYSLVLQLKKQTEIQAAQQAAWEAKEQAEQLRKEIRDMELAEVS